MFREAISENRHILERRPFQEAGRGQHVQISYGTKQPVFQKPAGAAGGERGEAAAEEEVGREAEPDPEAV